MARRNGLPRHCSFNWDRVDGKRRVRFRKGSLSCYLPGLPYSDEFNKAYYEALDGVKTQAVMGAGSGRTKPGSFNALCVLYYGSSEWSRLAPQTQKKRRNIIEKFRLSYGDKPVRGLERSHIKAILAAKSATPQSANNLLKVLSVLLSFAVELELIAANSAGGIKKYRSEGDGYHTWKEAEIAQFEATYPFGTRPRLAMALLLYSAQRTADVIRMGWQHVEGDCIAVRQQKTGTPLLIPIHPELTRVLAVTPKGNLNFLLTGQGAPFSAGGFGNWFTKCCKDAGLTQCTAHGLRKAAATRLANSGCSTDQIKAITGHKSLSEVSRYTRSADQARLARQAMEKIGNNENKKLEIAVQHGTTLAKTGV